MNLLDDYCIFIRNGANIKNSKDKSGIPITRIETISDNVIDENKYGYADIFDNKYEDYYLKKNDILMSHINSLKHLGKTAFCEEDKKVIHGMNLLCIRSNNKINPKYLNYYFKSDDFYKKLMKISKQSVNQSSFAISDLKKIEIIVLDKDLQDKLVKKIEKIEQLIKIRRQQLIGLDNLVKSLFVKMFGNPIVNSKWEINKLGKIAQSIADGSNVDTKYYQNEGEVLFLRIQNVWRNEFRLDDSVYITQEVNQMYKDTSLKNGDIMISKIGRYYTKDSSLGRVSIYNGEDDKANYSNNVMRIRLKKGYNSNFINTLLNLDDYQIYIRRESKGGTDKRALSKKIIEDFPIINPPIELQNKFINLVKQIDKQKFKIQKSLKEMEELKESLMNKYFG